MSIFLFAPLQVSGQKKDYSQVEKVFEGHLPLRLTPSTLNLWLLLCNAVCL
jgi:hypothetical protein